MRPLANRRAREPSNWIERAARKLRYPGGISRGKRTAEKTHPKSRGRTAETFGGRGDQSTGCKQLLDFRAQLPGKAVTASIIANSASSWFQSCLLDKGSADGVRKGMAVVTPLGVVGQSRFGDSRARAKVLLLTDPNSGIDVLVQRTRARGIVSGSLENGTVLKYVKRSEDIQEGDRLITSGIDGVFPKGMMVGHGDQGDANSISVCFNSSRFFRRCNRLASKKCWSSPRRATRKRSELSPLPLAIFP